MTEFDERSEKNIATLIPEAQDTFRKLLRVAQARAADLGCVVKVISGNRSYAEQNALYAQGRTTPGPGASKKRPMGSIVTKAKGGYSNHNFGIAVDLGLFADGKYLDSDNPAKASRVYSSIAEAVKAAKLPVEWGGDWKSFKDIPHWEFKTGLSMAQKRAAVALGKRLA